MEQDSLLQQVFYHYVLSRPELLKNVEPDFFDNKFLQKIFKQAKLFFEKYHETPTAEQLIEISKIEGLIGDDFSIEAINILYSKKEDISNTYDDKWLEENTIAWISYRKLILSMNKALVYIKTGDISVDNISHAVETVRQIIMNGTNVVFDDDAGLDFFDATAHSQKRLEKSPTGYDYIDLCQKGGNWKGSLVCYIAGPKCGKSFWLCNLAAESVKLGKNTLYITLELQQEIVAMRIGANLLQIPLDEYENLSKDEILLKKKLTDFRDSSLIPVGSLRIKEYPSSCASATDVEHYVLKMEDELGIKFDEIYIDYLNIMKDWRNPNGENTYLKIKHIAEDVRAAAQRNNWTIITASQVNRESINSSDFSMTAVSESMALVHTVDMLYGILNTNEMKANNYWYIKCLADRIAPYENTRQKFNINWTYGRFVQSDEPMEDLDFKPEYAKHLEGKNYKGNNNPNKKQTPKSTNFKSVTYPVDADVPTEISGNVDIDVVNITGANVF